jgi:hypothetical protein
MGKRYVCNEFVLLEREQGGAENLVKENIKVMRGM